jgi:hypothetical protein
MHPPRQVQVPFHRQPFGKDVTGDVVVGAGRGKFGQLSGGARRQLERIAQAGR